MDYCELFDDIFQKYTSRHENISVKTTNMGILYKLTYNVTLKGTLLEKQFLDELRCRNGNLDGSYDAENAIAISLQGSSASCDSNLVKIEGSTITINSEGVYILKGTLENGQIIVDADQSKVQLVLSGASVTCQSSVAVYVKQADKVFLTLDENTENTLSTSGEFVQTDDNTVDGVVFSKDDITVNGKGKLTVTTGNGHGIVSKDELTMTGGEITIQASGHALSGKDSVCIADGNYQLTAGTDGIHSDNEEDTAKGFIYIGGGTFQITSASDGLDASGRIRIDHGTLTLNCDDDGIHADTALYIADGTIDVQKSNEGLESAMILIDSGTIHVVSSDDGLNASGGDGFQTDTGARSGNRRKRGGRTVTS